MKTINQYYSSLTAIITASTFLLGFDIVVGPKSNTGIFFVTASSSDEKVEFRNLRASPWDPDDNGDGVHVSESTTNIYYVDEIPNIGNGAPDYAKEVRTLELKNNAGIHVTTMAEGGTMLQMSLNDQDYLWDNKEGGVYYGPDTNNFPLRRGLILHGGSRACAVAGEHGLYYDIDWDMSFDDGGDGNTDNEKSIILQLTDNAEARARVGRSYGENPFSQGQWNRGDMNGPDDRLTKYPITNLVYTYKISLRPDEDFVRLTMKVDNPTNEPANAEAWVNFAFPVNEQSIILDQQKLRWRRDEWVFPFMPNIVDWEADPTLSKPLSWPGPGIFYDFPSMEGNFHGVVSDPAAGRGIVYVAPETSTHYNKLWSWGDKAQGGTNFPERPFTDYYEPWSSGFNFGFFQTYQFKPNTCYSWQLALVPIPSGLTSDNKDILVDTVKDYLADRPGLSTIGDVEEQSCAALKK